MTLAVNIAQSGSNNVTMRNRIINGAMTIDQRNAGASVSLAAGGGGYPADRWFTENSTAGTATVQQVNDAPTGFSSSIKWTVTGTAASLGSTDSAFFQQKIEGFNTSDLVFGTASAQPVAVSFWVKSSVTGTFGGSLANSAYNRGYAFSFVISAANTWEFKTVTIPGDTTGTWIGATNGIGIRLSICVGAGTSRVATANTWSASVVLGATGQVNLMATSSASLQITGVQLEEGTAASPFENRLYGTELQLCQRYYYRYKGSDSYSSNANTIANGQFDSSTRAFYLVRFPVPMRATPSIGSTSSGFTMQNLGVGVDGFNASVNTVYNISSLTTAFTATCSSSGASADRGSWLTTNSASSYFDVSAEL